MKVASIVTACQPSCEASGQLPMPSGDREHSHEARNRCLVLEILGIEIAQGSRPRRVPGRPNTLRFGKRQFQVTAEAAMSSGYLDQVEGDKFVFPGRPSRYFWDDTISPPTLIC